MEEFTGFGMNDCLSLAEMWWKYFDPLRTDEDERVYIYKGKCMRWFVRQSLKSQICAYKQYYKPKMCDKILKCISEDLNFRGIFYHIMEGYLNNENKYLKIVKKEWNFHWITRFRFGITGNLYKCWIK